MLSRRTTTRDPEASEAPRRDDGTTFIELLVSIVLIGTAVLAALAAVRATVIGTAIERDHSKAQQWLQAAAEVIEDVQYFDCNSPPDGPTVRDYYQGEVDAKAAPPFGFEGGAADIAVSIPLVWDGTKYIPFASQPSACYDDFLLRQQLVTITVTSPGGDIVESVEIVKKDRP